MVHGIAGGDEATEDEIEDEVVLVVSDKTDVVPHGALLASGLRHT